jgi:hypothetical protein
VHRANRAEPEHTWLHRRDAVGDEARHGLDAMRLGPGAIGEFAMNIVLIGDEGPLRHHRAGAREGQGIVSITDFAPARIPPGHLLVMVLRRV